MCEENLFGYLVVCLEARDENDDQDLSRFVDDDDDDDSGPNGTRC